MERAWAQYDPRRANELLDGLKLGRGPDGVRMRPDGAPLRITIDHASTPGSGEAKAHELVGSHASGTHVVELRDVAVPPERLVGRAGTGLAHVLDFLRLERAWAAAACSAIAELCFEMALAYAGEREIAGRSLAGHQAIAHRLA